jgi:hypothetical protein
MMRRMKNTKTNAAKTIDTLTARYTAFNTLAELLAVAGYVPSIRAKTGFRTAKSRAELTRLANAYDKGQAARGDSRRAWRC